ncbi:MAG: transposase [Chloroflexi bacterium HGW-Chloroflexi-6]|nr:MAG: transposase [Chloroflexi bacterium HGW-Chloroflexi-6]
MPTDIIPVTLGTFFHIYNRGNNRENIFFQPRNYAYFMELWWKHTSLIAETWAYCLLRNHFHALVFIRNREELPDQNIKEPSQYFSNFFNAYARGVNLATGRTGALFERPFKRIPVDSENYLIRLVVYIHQNPQKHKFIEDFRDWDYSSYPHLISNAPTRLQRNRMMDLFGSQDDFIRIHQEIQPLEDWDDED